MSVRRSLGWVFSGQIIGNGLGFLSSVIIARILTPHELGVYTIGVATSGILSVFVNFGTQTYAVREKNLTPQIFNTAFTTQLILCIFLSTVIFAISFAGTTVLGDPGVGWVLRIMALSPLIGVLSFRPSVILQRSMQFRSPTIIAGLAGAVNIVAVVILAINHFSYLSLAFATVLSNVFTAVALNFVVPRQQGNRLSLIGWRPMIVFGVRIMSVNGAGVLAQRSSELILGHMLGLSSLALYSRASSISSIVFSNLYGSATGVIFTKLSKDYRERGVLRDAFIPGLDMILGVMWPAIISLAVLSRPFIRVVYGTQWLGAAAPLSLLMVSLFFTLSFGMNWELFVLRDETALQTKYELIRSGLGCVLFSIGCFFNIVVATAGRTVDSFIGAIFYFPKMGRLSGATAGELAAIYAGGLMLTAAAVTPSLVLMLWLNWDANASLGELATCVTMGIGLWALTLYLLDHVLLREARYIARALPIVGPFFRNVLQREV